MSGMKMSEHFPEAFQVDHNKSFEVQDATWYSYGEKYGSDGDQDSAIEHAVLNHDRLQQENAALKEANAWHVNRTKELHEDNAELRESESDLVNEIEDLRGALSVLSDADNHSVSQVRTAMRKARLLMNK